MVRRDISGMSNLYDAVLLITMSEIGSISECSFTLRLYGLNITKIQLNRRPV